MESNDNTFFVEIGCWDIHVQWLHSLIWIKVRAPLSFLYFVIPFTITSLDAYKTIII